MGLRKLNTAERRQRHGGRARNFSLAFRRQNRFEVAQDLVVAHASAAWAAQMGRRVATSDQEGDRRPEEDLAGSCDRSCAGVARPKNRQSVNSTGIARNTPSPHGLGAL